MGTEKQVVRVRLLRAQAVAFFRHGFSRSAHDELLDWQVAHAINVTINGVSVGTSGANIVIDPDDQLTLRCYGFGGPVNARA